MKDAPRERLVRMHDFQSTDVLLRLDENDDGSGTLVGMPIVFDEWAEIAGWEGHFLERIGPRSLTKTLRENSDSIKVLFNHGLDPTIGQKPLGVPDVMRVTRDGLWTETPLAATSYNADLRELLRVEAIDGMSFQFTVQRDEWNDEPGVSDWNLQGIPERTVKELRLFEFGPVTFPAYAASTAGVRGQSAYEAWLSAAERDREGFSISNATLTIASDDAPPLDGHPSATGKDVARLARAVTRSLKEHNDGETSRTTL